MNIIVTRNGKDIPYSDDLPYEIYEMDDFLVLINEATPQAAQAATDAVALLFIENALRTKA